MRNPYYFNPTTSNVALQKREQMKKLLHKADTRIINDFGWLRISASFRQESPTADRKNFGRLVILDDALMIPAGRGFTLHPHDNMEIISWILSGTDEHHDNTHGINLIGPGEVQLMSAGTGIEHAENNYSETEAVHMFQIWVEPKTLNVKPRYQVKSLANLDRLNKLVTFISPDGADDSLIINQNSYFSIAGLTTEKCIAYRLNQPGNGVYVFVLYGSVQAEGITLSHRDALAVTEADTLLIQANQKSEILFIEVPI